MKRFFSRWLSRLLRRSRPAPDTQHGMIDCESAMRQLWDFLDGQLTPERMEQVRAHIDMCQRCYPQYEFERTFLETIAARRRTHSDPARLRARVLTALAEQGLSGA